MGTWGVGLFDDDVACSVRDDYFALLEHELTPDAAADQLLVDYADENSPVIVLALAATQLQDGYLSDVVAARAQACIEDGAAIRVWDTASESTRIERQRVLDELHRALTE